MSTASRKYPRKVPSKKGLTKTVVSNKELFEQDSWRIFRIMSEFVDGFEMMADIGPAVTIFGSARTKPEEEPYKKTYTISKKLAKAGFSIITGGGPGLMEAANKGASEGGGQSIGLNIELPMEQSSNEFVNLPIGFRYFFIRKVMFIKYAQAVLITPGGLGTLDECFEVLTLIQTNKIKNVPVILVGKAYWKGLLDWIYKDMIPSGMLDKDELSMLKVMDDPNEIVREVKKATKGIKTCEANF